MGMDKQQLAEPAMQIGIGLSKGSSGGFASILIHVGTSVYETCVC